MVQLDMNNLRKIREARELKLEQVAEGVGTSIQQVQRLEKGDRKLDAEWLVKFAKFYNLTPLEILADRKSSEVWAAEIQMLNEKYRKRLMEDLETYKLAQRAELPNS